MPVQLNELLLFLGGSILINIVPGADMALVMRQVFLGGTRLARRTILGNMTGILVHATALAAGLSALLYASAEAFTALKLAGAAYLVFLGIQTLRSARRAQWHDDAVEGAAPGVRRSVPSMRLAYMQGLVSTVLNPKPAILFLTYIPQFLDTSRAVLPQIAFLTAVHILIGIVWLNAYAVLIARAHRTLTKPSVRRWLESATGTVLILLGLRVAVEQR
jgi:threonine/homoserine/homoserine lactone efflux protein